MSDESSPGEIRLNKNSRKKVRTNWTVVDRDKVSGGEEEVREEERR